MVDEKKLLSGLLKNDKNSLEQAIELYTPYLSTVLFNLAGTSLPREDIEEIVSDVFVVLWRKAEYIDLTKGTLRSYIAAAAKNYALKRLDKKREYTPIDELELSDECSDNSDLISELLWKAVMELGEPDNEIFVRFYRYDERLKDISKATGLNISTVKTKLKRGKEKLKKILNAEDLL